jgi:hypothetical protein
MPSRPLSAPLVTASLVALLGIMILGWGAGARGPRRATIPNLRADLADSGCIFTADIELGSMWQQLAFSRVREDARTQFKAIMRGKRRYMVDSAVARQALSAEFAWTINRLANAEIAERVEFPRFELF